MRIEQLLTRELVGRKHMPVGAEQVLGMGCIDSFHYSDSDLKMVVSWLGLVNGQGHGLGFEPGAVTGSKIAAEGR